ncbi:hypothetical protein N7493_004653 [Penicillium malachiteum]|uniref:Transcription factor TFIIIC complex subunit Tfc6 n=1 Tax=Penicillium malachiteum TaxID=1324776 RepID=A0AAD6MX81_9EURO|nr:hypothetical protein N7493_004653 [Penicillium malachiteum]
MAAGRRSARNKGPRAVYNEDPFVSAGISDESSSERPEKSSKKKARKWEDHGSDEEFVAGPEPDVVDDEGENEDEGDEDIEEEDDMDEEDDDAMDVDEIASTPKSKSKSKRAPASKLRKQTTAQKAQTAQESIAPLTSSGAESHHRGMLDSRDQVSKFMHYTLTYGSDDRDLGLTIHMRGRWRWGRDATYPTRLSLEQTHGESDSPCGPTLGVTPEDVEKERKEGWAWYYDEEIGEKFRKRQRVDKKLKEAEARRKYLPQPKKNTHTVLLGPANDQQAFELGYHEAMDVSQAWEEQQSEGSDQAKTKLHQGWLINIGQKIQCMAWAPNQDDLPQYLALAVPVTEDQTKKYMNPEGEPLSSFIPSPPYPAAIQLWEFMGKKAGYQTNTIDMDVEPHLRLVLCTEWGHLRQMAWCPMGRERRGQVDNDLIDIGLLAGVWGDGKVRVLDIKLQKGSKKLQIVRVTSPAFEAIMPSTICTTVAWLSPSDIAVGCANGFVALWSILPSSSPDPYLYHPIHTSYVLNITSGYPTYPHLVSTISVDGETRMWSIIDPIGENTNTVRVRLSSSQLSYSPVLQAFCSSDENEYGRLMPIRRFFATNASGRLNSTVSALAPCSFWHPSLLFGGTGGEVMATNPMRRIMYGKEPQWQQMWFIHHWVPGPDDNSPGVSRFHEGFRAENPGVVKSGEGRPMGLSLTTIHDEDTHVTALGWNPNRSCAGWGSAALGCGLLRVEDLTV